MAKKSSNAGRWIKFASCNAVCAAAFILQCRCVQTSWTGLRLTRKLCGRAGHCWQQGNLFNKRTIRRIHLQKFYKSYEVKKLPNPFIRNYARKVATMSANSDGYKSSAVKAKQEFKINYGVYCSIYSGTAVRCRNKTHSYFSINTQEVWAKWRRFMYSYNFFHKDKRMRLRFIIIISNL